MTGRVRLCACDLSSDHLALEARASHANDPDPLVGRTLLHDEVLEKLGEGGIGVVYKARDPRLDRLVAPKVLPSIRTADPVSREPFIREARAASALNHPHIVTIYDIANAGGTDFIVSAWTSPARRANRRRRDE